MYYVTALMCCFHFSIFLGLRKYRNVIMYVKLMFLYCFLLFFISSYGNTTERPNFIIFYIEHINEILPDLQSPTLGEELKNLNSLIKESTTFHNIYGESSSASTFASLFTGKPAVDLGIIQGKLLPFNSFPSLASSGGLNTNEQTVAKLLLTNGYLTWFSGFWKLGLGPEGKDYPTSHGFISWLGVAYPHNEWCEQQKSVITNQETLLNHPYLKLFYRTSFLWLILFLFLTVLVWFKFITLNLYLNLLVYTFSTALAFYILLHLFIVQRSASCVLYYQDVIAQQPYDMTNVTLQFTQHSGKLLDTVSGLSPFFMVLNYLKMKPPYMHSSYFTTARARARQNALFELDWSVGFIMEKLKKYDVYKNTMIILTGGGNSYSKNLREPLKGFHKEGSTQFQEVEGIFYVIMQRVQLLKFVSCLAWTGNYY
jgi:Arylsulfatase A and related enzymes